MCKFYGRSLSHSVTDTHILVYLHELWEDATVFEVSDPNPLESCCTIDWPRSVGRAFQEGRHVPISSPCVSGIKLHVHVHIVPTGSVYALLSGVVFFTSRFFALVAPLVVTVFAPDNAGEQCADTLRRTAVALPVRDVLTRFNFRGLRKVISRSDLIEEQSRCEHVHRPNSRSRRNAIPGSPRLLRA